jgi:NDP-sugar pyrophosphorylase family protein
VLAVTQHVDDERPLRIAVDPDMNVTAIGPDAEGSEWISAGLYFFRPSIFAEIPRARELQLSRLRKFQEHLVKSGYTLLAHPFKTVVDVDHPEDVSSAERHLESWGRLNVSGNRE